MGFTVPFQAVFISPGQEQQQLRPIMLFRLCCFAEIVPSDYGLSPSLMDLSKSIFQVKLFSCFVILFLYIWNNLFSRVGSITFKWYFNYKIQITFFESISNTIFNYFCYGGQNTKYKIHFCKVIKIQVTFKNVLIDLLVAILLHTEQKAVCQYSIVNSVIVIAII